MATSSTAPIPTSQQELQLTTAQGQKLNGFSGIANFLWSVADLLRGAYKQADYGKVILPMTVLRRLDCVLEPTKAKVLAKAEAMKGGKVKEQNLGPVLNRITGVPFHNVSKLDFEKLKGDPNHIGPNLLKYIEGFSADVSDIFLVRFEFPKRAALCDVEGDAARRHLQGSGHDEVAQLRRQTVMRQFAVGLGHAEEMLIVAPLLDVFEHRARQQLEVRGWPVRQVTAQ